MQLAHSSSSWVGVPLGSVVVVLPLASLLVLPRLATWGELPPPQAANPSAASAAAVANPLDRPYLVVMSRLPRGYSIRRRCTPAGIKQA